MGLLPKIEEDLENILHPIDALVEKKVAEAEADVKAAAAEEKAKIAADVKAAIAKAKADAIAATPAIEASAQVAFDDALKAAVAALAAYGV